ncbi:calcium/sodium antiporter [Dehalococcoidia bacterium]|nr:calcium/sodium antiporter [Dehalococcoidia bacterium]
MLSLLIWGTVFVVSLYVLIKAADYFTDAAEKIGSSLGIPLFVVGVIIVAIGTSLPEFSVGIFAALANASEIVAGDVVGSNTTNISLVIGIGIAMSKKMRFDHRVSKMDLAFLLGSAFLLPITMWDGVVTSLEAVLFLITLVFYLIYTVWAGKKQNAAEIGQAAPAKLHWKNLGILIVSLVFIYLGATYTVEAIVRLAEIFGVGKEIIALCAVALGTSLPEVTVTIAASRKGMTEMIFGNIVGSCIFNALGVIGVSGLIAPLVVPRVILTFALPLMLTTTLFFFFLVQRKEFARWQGMLLLAGYVVFVGAVVALGVL